MIKIANAPCSWGVLEFEMDGEPAGYGQVLDEIRQTGYRGTELGDFGFLPTEPDLLRREISKRDLTLLGAFIPVYLADARAHQDGIEEALMAARLLAAAAGPTPFIVLSDDNCRDERRAFNAGRILPEHGLTDAQWLVFAEGAEAVARAVMVETGLRTVFHHHCGGYVETPQEVDRLLASTDPRLLGLCLDTGHYTLGGGDPIAALNQHVDRVWHVHLKDCHPGIAARAQREGWDYLTAVQHGVFCELGKGSVDFPAFLQRLNFHGYDGWAVVEQDVLAGMGSPKESAQRNRDYLRAIGL